MSKTTNSTILSQPTEQFHYLTIQNHQIILSAEDTLDLNAFITDSSPHDFSVYAEGISLTKALRIKSALISANHIIPNIETSQVLIDVSGQKGADVENIHMTPSPPPEKGEDGQCSGNLHLYLEHVDADHRYKLLAHGGDGGHGQGGLVASPTAGGDGGHGGKGGNVQFIFIPPYQRMLSTLVSIYETPSYPAIKKELRTCIESIETSSTPNSMSILRDKLQQALHNTTTKEQLKEAILAQINRLSNLDESWKINQVQIDVSGGIYGPAGRGDPPGQNGLDGEQGTSTVIPLDSPQSLLEEKVALFLFVHPSQCAITLEKAKLMYFSLDPVQNKNGIRDLTVLLKRLQERTAIFSTLQDASALAHYYPLHESSIGAIHSIQSLQQTYTGATNLLNSLATGLDFFGYRSNYVPLTSFQFQQGALEGLVSNFDSIEIEYNSYYEKLKTNSVTSATIQTVKAQQSTIIEQADLSIKQLRSKLLESANLITYYQYLTTATEGPMQTQLKKFEEEVQKHYEYNIDSLISALTMLAFAPTSKLMWITQIAELGITANEKSKTITDDQGDNVTTDYLLKKINKLQPSLSGLWEGYSTRSDGKLDADDPRATKLLASEEEVMAVLDKFYNVFPTTLKELKKLIQDYIKKILARNNELLTYNALVQLLRKYHQQINQANQKRNALGNAQKNSLDPTLPEIASFVSQMYYHNRSIIMETIDLAVRAYRFWSLATHRNLFENTSLPEITAATFKSIQNNIFKNYAVALENFGNDAGRFNGTILSLNEIQMNYLKAHHDLLLSIPVVKRETEGDNPFAGSCNIRLSKVRVWVVGAKTKTNLLQVNIVHTGKEKIVNADNDVFTFEHDPKFIIFKYNLLTNDFTDMGGEDGDIGCLDHESNEKYALVGPFTDWRIFISDAWNKGLDLSEVTAVHIEFHGTNYSFHSPPLSPT